MFLILKNEIVTTIYNEVFYNFGHLILHPILWNIYLITWFGML